ncbi:MAG: hypothetical protein Q8941_08230 [Bacteroidota bacterium]|nr:hypothetical protein [Bacteroidota bacterium]
MKKGILITVAVSALLVYASSCYNNKEDVLSLPKVSFRSEVVPIVTAGACGCHNNGQGARAVQFSHADTIFYDAILSRVSLFQTWVNGGTHPGGGVIDFSSNERLIIKRWIDQGASDDAAGSCTVVGTPTYNANILAIYTTTCKGPTCHGGLGPVLDYNKMVADKTTISTIMNSSGTSGHPGGTLSLSSCTINIFKDWIAQGQPQ